MVHLFQYFHHCPCQCQFAAAAAGGMYWFDSLKRELSPTVLVVAVVVVGAA